MFLLLEMNGQDINNERQTIYNERYKKKKTEIRQHNERDKII